LSGRPCRSGRRRARHAPSLPGGTSLTSPHARTPNHSLVHSVRAHARALRAQHVRTRQNSERNTHARARTQSATRTHARALRAQHARTRTLSATRTHEHSERSAHTRGRTQSATRTHARALRAQHARAKFCQSAQSAAIQSKNIATPTTSYDVLTSNGRATKQEGRPACARTYKTILQNWAVACLTRPSVVAPAAGSPSCLVLSRGWADAELECAGPGVCARVPAGVGGARPPRGLSRHRPGTGSHIARLPS